MTRRLLALAAVLGGLLAAALLLAGPASAHATVVTSSPADGSRLAAAPSSVTITFDESVGLGSIGYLHVTDATGKRVDAGKAGYAGGNQSKVVDKLQGGLGNGTYTASFRVISADSHPVAGTIRFVVGDGPLVRGTVTATGGSTLTQVVFDVVRWVSYAGLALLGGAWVVLSVWPEGRDDRRARRIVWGGWGLAALGGVAELLIQGPYTAGLKPWRIVDTTLLDATLHTNYGEVHSARLLVLGLVALMFAAAFQADAIPSRWDAVTGVLGVGLVLTFSSAGHPDTTSPRWLSIGVDMAHLLAMMTWVGGLVVLLAAVLPRREPGELRAVLPVVSTVAFWSVVVLAASGTYSAWRGIGSLSAIFTTTYGLLVVAKVVLFLGLVALGNLSRRTVRQRFTHPQLAYAMTDAALDEDVVGDDDDRADDDHVPDDDPISTERLRRSVFVEVLVAACVLALTAVLVAEPRGKEALAAQYRSPVTASAPFRSGEKITVSSDPGTHGNVNLTVDLPEDVTATKVTATATQSDKQIGPIPIKLARAGSTSYDGSVALPVAGPWRIDLVVTTSAFDAVTTSATIHLH